MLRRPYTIVLLSWLSASILHPTQRKKEIYRQAVAQKRGTITLQEQEG